MLGPKNFAGNTSCTWQLGKPRGLLRFWGLGSRFFKELVVRQLNLEFKASCCSRFADKPPTKPPFFHPKTGSYPWRSTNSVGFLVAFIPWYEVDEAPPVWNLINIWPPCRMLNPNLSLISVFSCPFRPPPKKTKQNGRIRDPSHLLRLAGPSLPSLELQQIHKVARLTARQSRRRPWKVTWLSRVGRCCR